MSLIRRGRVLIVDDDPEWQKNLVQYLEREGFHAEAASSAAEALQRLQEALYHLIVLDLQLGQGNAMNREGFNLLAELKQRGLTEAINVVLLSAHSTPELIREAFRDHAVADFLNKETFEASEFIKNIRNAFVNNGNTNLALDIIWQGGSSALQAVAGLDLQWQSTAQESEMRQRMAYELEDLLARLFCEAESIIVRPLAPSLSRSGAGVLSVQPFYGAGGGHTVVVKFGAYSKIQQEAQCFKQFVRPYVAGGRSTVIEDVRRTPRLGGIIYSLLGAANDTWTDFAQFYRHNSAAMVRSAIHRLFEDTCGAWYANPGRFFPLDLTEVYCGQYGGSLDTLEQAARRLPGVLLDDNGKLTFTALGPVHQDFSNPFPFVRSHRLIYPTYQCFTHGDLNQHNILIDDAGHLWLVDFEKAGRSHILRDVVTLDAIVRFQLLAADEATLQERLAMERALCRNRHFRQVGQLTTRFQTTNRMLAKAYETVIALRQIAWWLVDQKPNDDMCEYYAGLLFNALNTLQFSTLAPVQREHALLSASLAAEVLDGY